jgi:hypothetical protein
MTKEKQIKLKFLKEHLRRGLIWFTSVYNDAQVEKILKEEFGWTDEQIARESNTFSLLKKMIRSLLIQK